ncbi:MAG TPA: BRCT domain-containing protein, partial [Aquella sp.]|nr:BRCT domain-containing protein [Aquella sp.]
MFPRIHYEPVKLSGATLSYASGFNAKFIVTNSIGPGAKIKVVRSGDTIPDVMEIIKPAKKPSLPDVNYKWDKTNVNIILTNASENKTVIIQRLTKFLRDIGVENMSEGIVTKLVNNDYDTIPKVMKLTVDDLLELEGFQRTLAEKLIHNLSEKISELTILKLMVASNCFGRGFGERKIRKILDVYPKIVSEYDVADHDAWLKKIIEIDGFNTVTAKHFLSHLPDFQKFYLVIKKIKPVTAKHIVSTKSEGLFKDEVVVFTGFRSVPWQKFVEEEGGRISTSVSGNTTLLVYADGEETSAKYIKAKQLGIQLMSK